jgi:PAS domain S-box-containing protein
MKVKPTYEELERRVQELEKNEHELEYSREMLRVFEKASLAYQSLDAYDRYIAVNQAWLDTLGYVKEEVIGKFFADFIHPDRRDHFQENFSRFKSIGEILGVEFEMVKKNGDIIQISLTGKINRTEKGEFQQTHCIFYDITERKRVEEENRRFRTLADNAVYGKAIADLQGRLLYVNHFFAHIHGYSPEELIGRHIPVFHSQNQMVAADRLIESMMREGHFVPTTVWHRHQDGTEFPMLMSGILIKDDDGNPQCIATTAIDISAQHQAEVKIAERERILRDIVESTLSGFWDWNLVDNTEYLSPTFKRMFGYEDHEMENSPEAWQKIIFPEDLPGVLEVFDRHVKSCGREPFYNEVRYRHRDGSTVWVICTGRVIKWAEDGTAIRMVGCHMDITERKLAEKALRESEEKYRLIFNMGVNAMFLVDDNTTQILDCNNKACQLFGYSLQKLLSMKMTDLSMTPEATRRACRENVSKQERVYQKQDGGVMSVEITSEHFYLDNRAVHISAITDITDKKLAEEALKASEERFNLAMDASRDGVYEWNLATREIYYSPGWKRMLGYEPHELPDDFSVWENLTRPEDVENSWQIMQEVVEGKRERFEVELEMRHKDGHWVHILSRSSIYKDAGGKPVRVIGTHVDITESNRQRERLSLSESRYRKAQALAKVGNWEYNLKTKEYWGSDEAKIIYGLDPKKDSFSAEEVESCIIEREKVHQAMVDLIENGKPYNLEFDIITNNTGEIKTIVSIAEIERDGAKNSVKISGVIHDITERKRAEEELRRRENQLQRIFEILPIGLWFADKKGTLLRGNPMGVRIWGAEPTVPISEYGVFKARHLPSRKLLQADEWALAKTIRNGETIVDELLEIESFDGKRKTILNYTAPVLDGDGQVDGAIVVNLDISDRKALEDQLLQAQKMETVGRLAGGVAHDFNNMLGVILGYSEMALEQMSADQPMYKAVKKIQQAAQRSADLTSQLLAFARKQAIAPRVIDINETVEGMLSMLRRLIGEDKLVGTVLLESQLPVLDNAPGKVVPAKGQDKNSGEHRQGFCSSQLADAAVAQQGADLEIFKEGRNPVMQSFCLLLLLVVLGIVHLSLFFLILLMIFANPMFLEAKGLDSRPVELGKTSSLKIGDRVYAVGALQGLELSLSDGIVSQLRGVAYSKLGRDNDAIEAYRQALRIGPEYALA